MGNYTILPTLITSFGGQPASGKVNLNWTTTSGNAYQYFEVERSIDGTAFTRLTDVPEVQGSSVKTYQYTDELPFNGINYYRLKYVFPDGHNSYSAIVSVRTNQSDDFTILANPANEAVRVVIKKPVTLILSDVSGHALQTYYLSPGIQVIRTGQLSNGIYFLQLIKGGRSQKFCVSR
ncbi:MAG: hypothetical protein NVSMB7_11960 [Chitinophagaceae bacterium]